MINNMKRRYLKFIIVLSFLIGFLSNIDNLKRKTIEVYYIDKFMEKEKIAVVEKGDTSAYKTLKASMEADGRIPRSSTFYYSMIMAIYFDYSPANYDAYKTIQDVYPHRETMDADTKKLCAFFLKRDADRDDNRCLEIIKKQNIPYRKIYVQKSDVSNE